MNRDLNNSTNHPENQSAGKGDSVLWSAIKTGVALGALCLPPAHIFAAEETQANNAKPVPAAKAVQQNQFDWGEQEALHQAIIKSDGAWKFNEIERLMSETGYKLESVNVTYSGSRPHVSDGQVEVLFSRDVAKEGEPTHSIAWKLVTKFTAMDHPNGASKVIVDDVAFELAKNHELSLGSPVSFKIKLTDDLKKAMLEAAEGRSDTTIRLRLNNLRPLDAESTDTGIMALFNDPKEGRIIRALPHESKYAVGSVTFYPREEHPRASSFVLSLNATLQGMQERGELNLDKGEVTISLVAFPFDRSNEPHPVNVVVGGVAIEKSK